MGYRTCEVVIPLTRLQTQVDSPIILSANLLTHPLPRGMIQRKLQARTDMFILRLLAL